MHFLLKKKHCTVRVSCIKRILDLAYLAGHKVANIRLLLACRRRNNETRESAAIAVGQTTWIYSQTAVYHLQLNKNVIKQCT